MRRRLAIAALCLVLGALQYRLWAADGGVVDTRRLQQAVGRQAQVNGELQQRNAVLEAEVTDLRNGGAAIEAHARSELGMIRRGEAFYLVVGSPAAQ
ncbi:MAG: septum formation initiator family protein [Nevskia sp.]|nr:septum formation initiator family protein [Nevskia sp.]